MKELIETTLEEARQTLESFLEETTTVEVISQAASTCAEALKAGNKIISCGNGGSLCDATHFAEELTGRYRNNRIPLPAIAINDPAYMTCVGNDFSFNEIFSRYVEAMGCKGDVLFGHQHKRTFREHTESCRTSTQQWNESDSADFKRKE